MMCQDDLTQYWDAYKLGQMYSATHIQFAEYHGRPWYGHQPTSADLESLRFALHRQEPLSYEDVVDFRAGWFAAQRAHEHGHGPIELVHEHGEAE